MTAVPYSAEDLRYVNGEEFSTGRRFALPTGPVQPRLSLMADLCRGKSVLHVGCADHLGVIEEKRAAGTYLHQVLLDVATRVAGLDVSADALTLMRTLGYDDLHLADITEPWPDELRDRAFDFVVLGEILEHIDNPVHFLERLRHQGQGRVGTLVVTVPNAWSQVNLRALRHRQEFINTDHRYWFTPFTLTKVLQRAGWTATEIHMVEPMGLPHGIAGRVLRRRPELAEGLVATAVPSS